MKTLRNIVLAGIATTLLLTGCSKLENSNSYKRAVDIVNNPGQLVTGNVVQSKIEKISVYMENRDIYADINGQKRAISTNPAIDAAPILSPDKKKVAFNSDRNGEVAVYVIDVEPLLNFDRSSLKRLGAMSEDKLAYPVEWSEDSKKIKYSVWIKEQIGLVNGQFETVREGYTNKYEIDVESGKVTMDDSEMIKAMEKAAEKSGHPVSFD